MVTRKQASPDGRVLLVDSITQLTADDVGAWVVTGSHGGISSAHYALAHPMVLVVFNDAGVGKGNAGIAALALLQAQGRAAATVAHTSACIGDTLDAWQHAVFQWWRDPPPIAHGPDRAAPALGHMPLLVDEDCIGATRRLRGLPGGIL